MPFFDLKENYSFGVYVLYFLHGTCFSTWASRIPFIQQKLQVSDAHLGFLLFAIPIGDLLTMPFSGWAITKWGSRRLMRYALPLYASALVTLGYADTKVYFVAGLLLFGIASNFVNICVNTQSVLVQRRFDKSIMASFHGVWSLAGFLGALFGTWMMSWHVVVHAHFLYVGSAVCLIFVLVYPSLLKDEGEGGKASMFRKPDSSLLSLGFLACCCMACEGAMFDWSGIYFEKVVLADEKWVGLGYAAFMGTMTMGRFFSDRFISFFGIRPVLMGSGVLIAGGLAFAVTFPLLASATFGFCLVGFGVSSVVPIVYGQAGKSQKVPPPIALAMVSTIGFLGFLFGPPLVGTVAEMVDLRLSFALIALMGIGLAIGSKFVVK